MKGTPAAWVAVILAFGIALSLIFMTGAAIYVVFVTSGDPGTLGENTTQVLTGWGGGILGVLGAFVGYQFSDRDGKSGAPKSPEAPRPPKAPEAPKSPHEPPRGQQ